MGRIQSDKINLGSSFVVSSESSRISNDELKHAKQIAEKIIEEAKQKALIIEGQASTKAEAIIAEGTAKAHAQEEEITQAAKQRGYDAGYSDGFEKISSEMQEKIHNLDNFTAAEFDIKKRIIKSLHTDIIDLVLAVARKVCKTELKQNPELIEKLTLSAIEQLKDKESVNIIVNPIMAEKIYSVSEKIKETVQSLETVKIIEDSSISPDGTIVESIGSRVDSRLSAQIDKIAQELYNDLNTTSEDELLENIENHDSKIISENDSDKL